MDLLNFSKDIRHDIFGCLVVEAMMPN